MRIGVVAPSTPIRSDVAEAVTALAAAHAPDVEIVFHPQCFLVHNHFAGSDAARAEAFVAVANDPAFDALWFARGGYGSCRIAEEAIERLAPAARAKTYLGYSDAGYMLAGLYAAGFEQVAHGPMPQDVRREGGEAAVRRALDWLSRRDIGSLEPALALGSGGAGGTRAVAFNITVLSQLLGTSLQPALDGHMLLLEEVSEYMYRTDRAMFHITSNPGIRAVAGIRLGRCSLVPPNDPDFGESEEEVVRHWCERAGIAYLGRADIGHDADNKVVPFG
ncbi:LD-carboxypeptidase [Sphingomonas sp.]|uniref:LD-carboxypeptidase n=1 Tax=Sphingomonas sp. TaxID=28214 RepID=UPI002FC77FC1